jgi:peptidoglycan/LPS O-acetylase OafA/YrhL
MGQHIVVHEYRFEAKVLREQTKRPHIYELDPLRACTAFSVVAVHAFTFTIYLNHSEIGTQIQNALVVSLHFTREVFIFVTAFALVYVYSGKPFPLGQFWKKRSIGVLLPYVIWSVIYAVVNSPAKSPGPLLYIVVHDILTGNSSYQMYYILLTLQFYMIFPLFLLFLRRYARHPWLVLIVSFIFQVILFYVDDHTLQQSSFTTSHFWQVISVYQNRFILVYPFYFVLGGIVALYFDQVRMFLLRYGDIIVVGFLIVLGVLWLHFAFQVQVFGEPMEYATSVLQPIMVFYSTAVILFALWLTSWWVSRASKTNQDKRPRGYRFWRVLSDASFGVYLIHGLILTALLKWFVPAMPTTWLVAVRVLLTWLVTVGGATAISILLMNIPFVSHLVGRTSPSRSHSVQQQVRHPSSPVTARRYTVYEETPAR